ncbi:WD40 repeat domain-containing protein [Francisella philomiragia]|uniref:WD40 repeat domain-containing protein n=1 Tax=Francisella philomiragia TaxID=28110 RepID=UPI00190642ED|nr:WD40 repeat domain-containing protein [Francisella philomiragia]MBK2255718.1 WD40 repeat domain-containing protein [Francisella philomiragia]MBK2274029.1 WD40 repeat domain-containing protein [Francisella philomiragia]MBK2277876.1 WD40 repeat domain-containing protein [Francisella philomiragia]MBK2281819.1 WD40 repeat domain-containing protein [Francisella philomiragia]MBK2283774.1 WD40 repeat domain-containing protein [Francisella philomiragia]
MNIFKKIICILGLSATANLVIAMPTTLSISTDGKYAISSNNDGNVYLYNLNKKTIKKINDKTVNIFSANFIKDTHDFIYQTFDDNVVHIIDADTLKTIKSFTGQKNSVMQAVNKDLNTYAFATRGGNMNIAKIDNNKLGDTYSYGNQFMAMNSNLVPTFYKNKLITATGRGSLFIFDINEIFNSENKDNPKNQIEIHKNSGAVMSAIDPNGEFVYTADSSRVGIAYNLDTQKLISEKNGIYFTNEVADVTYLKNNEKKSIRQGISNFKFIDKDKIIVTFKGTSQPYLWAWFFTPSKFDWSGNGKYKRPMFYSDKYAKLVNNPLDYIIGNYNIEPRPNVDGYNYTFDTSVEAHKLVIGQANGNGIMVYNYNPSDETLKLDWVGEPPKVEDKKEDKSKGWFW